MRRLIIGCSAAALLFGGGALASSTAVQATTPPPSSSAPVEVSSIVGAWLLTVEEFPDEPPSPVAFHADGIYQQASGDGTAGIGSWEATGPNSFNLTFIVTFTIDDEGSTGIQTIRATGEVSEDGQTFTAEFTAEFTGEGLPPASTAPARDRNVYQRRADGHPGRLPGRPLPRLFARGGHRAGGQRTGRQRTSRQRTSRQRTSRQRTSRQRTSRQRTSRHRTSRHRTSRQRTSRQRTSRHRTTTVDNVIDGPPAPGCRRAQGWTRPSGGGRSAPDAGSVNANNSARRRALTTGRRRTSCPLRAVRRTDDRHGRALDRESCGGPRRPHVHADSGCRVAGLPTLSSVVFPKPGCRRCRR